MTEKEEREEQDKLDLANQPNPQPPLVNEPHIPWTERPDRSVRHSNYPISG